MKSLAQISTTQSDSNFEEFEKLDGKCMSRSEVTDVYRVLRAVMTMTEAREACLKRSAGGERASSARETIAMASEKSRERKKERMCKRRRDASAR